MWPTEWPFQDSKHLEKAWVCTFHTWTQTSYCFNKRIGCNTSKCTVRVNTIKYYYESLVSSRLLFCKINTWIVYFETYVPLRRSIIVPSSLSEQNKGQAKLQTLRGYSLQMSYCPFEVWFLALVFAGLFYLEHFTTVFSGCCPMMLSVYELSQI